MAIDDLLKDWHTRAESSQFAHIRTARHLSTLNYRLGIPAVILSAIVGTSIFASLEQTPSVTARVIIGLISIGTAVLSAVQTFLRYSERAEKHRAAGAAFSAIRREIQQIQSTGYPDGAQANTLIDGLRQRFDELAAHSPEVPAKIWDEVEGILAERRSLKG